VGEAGECGNEVAIAQLSLMEVFCVEAEGYFWLLDYLVCWDAVAEDMVVPPGGFLACGELEYAFSALDLVQLQPFGIVLVLVS
jgi:hypothetical protein